MKAILVLLAAPYILPAQQVPTIRLDLPAARHPAEWTDVVSVVEAQGGKLIVLDRRERQVKLVDMTARTATMIGMRGSGPGEYQLPMALFAIPGDSAILYDDANNARPLVISGDGRISPYSITNRTTPFLKAESMADWSGRFYRTGATYADLGPTGAAGPGIERLDRRTGRVDTIGFLSRKDSLCAFSAAPAKGPQKPDDRRASGRQPPPYLALEQWTVAPDGRVAIVCPTPYRVLLIDSTGKRTEGPVISYDRVRVGQREKAEWREMKQQPVAQMIFNRDGKVEASFQRQPPPAEPERWPDYLPPFVPVRGLNGAALFAPDGLLWIQRAVAAGAPSIYDIVGKNGALAYRVQLPVRTKVVGFGRRGIYAVTTDADGIELLSRFTFPPMNNR